VSRIRGSKQATIPEPYEDVASLRTVALATKELVEVLAGQRGAASDAAVTWGDLIKLQLINPGQVPPDIGSHRSQ
jgi:hypothetical protein